MRTKPAALLLLALSCLPALAAPLPTQGTATVVSGRAHVQRGPLGTYIHIEGSELAPPVTGFIAFGDEGSFPALADLEGRRVTITGVLVLDGGPEIDLTDPNQLTLDS